MLLRPCRDLFLTKPHRLAWYTRGLQRNFRSTALQNQFKILFLGRDEFSCSIFQELYASQDVWESIFVATNPDTRLGHSPLRALADSLNVPVDFIPAEKPDFKHWEPPPPFSPASAPPPLNHILITASFGRILTPAQLDLFAPARRLNVHGSVLPAYRGPAPIQHAILDHAAETGVSVAQMFKRGIDKGPVWASHQIPIARDATFLSLRAELADRGGRLLVRVLRDMLAGTAKCTPQPPESPTAHARSITIADAVLDFDTMRAADIVARHRAIGHQRALTTWMPSGVRLQLHDPAVAHAPPPTLSPVPGAFLYYKPERTLVVRCAGGTALAVPRVKKEWRSMLEAREFWNGVVPHAKLRVDGEFRLVGLEDGSTPTPAA
ncbi:formyl transferase [Mycena rosella]|uniref:methionyl-tRNA formyltransferase n=1 Tax=Mycena rosella TaxID=1033263 RepID=A0AAD7DRC1_MYCRO|nr:formyl transferase [Mycena rosella]